VAGRLVLGLDPGFANIGWALVEVGPKTEAPISIGIIRTEKRDRKGKIRITSDDHRRGKKIAENLRGLFEKKPVIVCAEALSYPRRASIAAKLGRVWGIIDCLSQSVGVPVIEASPMDLKLAVTGSKTASKEEVIESLLTRYPGNKAIQEFQLDVAKSYWEHGFDALGSVVACLESTEMQMLRRL